MNAWIQEHGGGKLIPFSVEFEQELNAVKETPIALESFIKDSGEAVSSLPKMIVAGYKNLNLIYFFTSGEKEVRAWTGTRHN